MITAERLDLKKTFECGQCFRWKRIKDDTYMGVIYQNLVIVKQGDDFSLLPPQTRALLKHYFALDIDYNIDPETLDDFAREAALFGRGIRMLRQEPWEALISFIISQRNNIPKISLVVERLCQKLGNQLETCFEGEQYTAYSFPKPEDIVEAGIPVLRELGLGYRDKYVYNAAKAVLEGAIDLGELCMHDGSEAVEELKKLNGVGTKVAECVALFGLGKLDRFPIDVWIDRAIKEHYNGKLGNYGQFAGLIQQYMFYYMKYGKQK